MARSDPVLLLFRADLRLADNLALSAAAQTGRPMLPAFILDEENEGVRPFGAAKKWWLHRSLTALADTLQALGTRLVRKRGKTVEVVRQLVAETGAGAVFWNRRYQPREAAADDAMAAALAAGGVEASSHDGALLHDPTMVATASGKPFQVFSAFWRVVQQADPPRPPADPQASLNAYGGKVASDRLDDWNLMPSKPNWWQPFEPIWSPGEHGAHQALDAFLDEAIDGYETGRDIPRRSGLC
ncbi:deoxyribodipyrimidine photo-lyase [Mesorhizobium sp. IMUNJ 23232]|uniref:deoxyribodipyrimidine photo-lyase n=1 Tax=Mesorhizobium sp. IMUNJ 23232 TaxID=3376064 RepID=UPI0037905003